MVIFRRFPGSHGAVAEQTLHPVNSIDT